MYNLSLLRSKKKVIELFKDGMHEVFSPAIFHFSDDNVTHDIKFIEIRTRKSIYGYFRIEHEEVLKEEDVVLINNSIQMLSTIIERLVIEQKLEDEKSSLERDAVKRLIELQTTIDELQKSRSASVNLIEDLSNEITKRELSESLLKKSEEELTKALEKAKESDSLKSSFLANMSHEIRTPMNGILGFSNLLKKPGISGDKQQSYISIIEKSGQRMLNTINDIIDISKIEAGQIDVSVSNVNVNEQLEYLHTFFLPEAGEKNIKLTVKNGLPNKESNIKTDSDKFNSILTNLIKNAVKYSEKGSIDFGYTKLGKISESQKNGINHDASGELEFYIKDTGIGIPKDRQQAVFDRFVQADIDDKQAFEGSGLGLAITKAYVELLGGKISLESIPEIGSTFRFTIPYITEKKEISRQGVETPDQNSQLSKNLTTLIVEDEEISRELLVVEMEELSKEILFASTGIEAVDLVQNNPEIDLVLMDIRMPEMNGYEATKLIREFNKNVIIIAQTAFALEGDRKKAKDIGCNDYISKPIDNNELMNLIRKYFKD